MHAHQMTDPEAVRQFLFAGNARVTLVSRRTGVRFTYRVAAPKQEASKVTHFVGILTGPENGADYTYMGHVYSDGTYRHGAKSRISYDAPSARAWRWFYRFLEVGKLHDDLEVWHEGRCGRCGRALTVPESIARGIGPECAGRA